jgi:hypothetical protein
MNSITYKQNNLKTTKASSKVFTPDEALDCIY